MNRVLSIGVALSLAACASTHPAKVAPQPTAAANGPPAGCVAQTATRIPVRPSECAAFGHTWSEQDVKRTGGADTAQALRLLDPTLTVRGQ